MSPSSTNTVAVFVGPSYDDELAAAVRDAGGTVADSADAAHAFVMTGGPDDLKDMDHDGLAWVQLGSAGIEGWFAAGALRSGVTYTSAAGAYGPGCAEHCLALMLALARRLDEHAAGTSWNRLEGTSLFGARVTIVGAGGIGQDLMRLMSPFGVTVDAVNHSGRAVSGAERTVRSAQLLEVIGDADYVVDCAPDTPDTKGLIGADALAAMKESAYLVNVGRGPTIATDALVEALSSGSITGAGLDVTEPEPLPDGHPLWSTPRTVITSHTANPGSLNKAALVERVRDNVGRLVRGEDLLGLVDLDHQY